MSPRIQTPPTRRKLARIRRAAIAAFLAFSPAPAESLASVDFTVGRSIPPASHPMEFAPGRDTMRDEINARFDEWGFPRQPLYTPAPARYDITSDDAELTCLNTARGTTARFKIETVYSGNLAGKRIVSVLVDGYRWEGFGFVDDFGIRVWGRKTGGATPSVFDRYAAFLMDLASAAARGVEITVERV